MNVDSTRLITSYVLFLELTYINLLTYNVFYIRKHYLVSYDIYSLIASTFISETFS